MTKLDLLRKLNKALSPNKVDFSAVETEINALKKKLEETVNIQTVDDVSRQLKLFQKKIDLEPIIREINKIGEIFNEKVKELQIQIDGKTKELENARSIIATNDNSGITRVKTLSGQVQSLKDELNQLRIVHEADIDFLNQSVAEAKAIDEQVKKNIEKIVENVNTRANKKDTEKSLREVEEKLETLRSDIFSRLSNIGGGAAHRQINVNSSVMSARYTDINFQQFGNIGWAAVNDDDNKRVNIRASILVGGGGSGGVTRTASVITANTAAASVASTDYVYIATAGLAFTLPPALSNTNLYTLKNASNSSVLVTVTGGETIDSTASVLVAINEQSLDFISDNTVWRIV